MYKIILWLFFIILISTNSLADNPVFVSSLEDSVALGESSSKPILIVFGAKWCIYCNKLKEDISNNLFNQELKDYIICYVDIDDRKDLKKEYNVTTIPDSRILKNKIEKSKLVGYIKPKYKKWLIDE